MDEVRFMRKELTLEMIEALMEEIFNDQSDAPGEHYDDQ